MFHNHYGSVPKRSCLAKPSWGTGVGVDHLLDAASGIEFITSLVFFLTGFGFWFDPLSHLIATPCFDRKVQGDSMVGRAVRSIRRQRVDLASPVVAACFIRAHLVTLAEPRPGRVI